mmetsp:Transcript_67553/g.187305  ORF Transcript_67553/g.187305 Transcript_67553/m.187305 type:complete len:219 (-) Transcript_67553:84-740(-)
MSSPGIRGPSPLRAGRGYPPRHDDEAGQPRQRSSSSKGPAKGLPPTPPPGADARGCSSAAGSASPGARGSGTLGSSAGVAVASFAAPPRPVSSRSGSPAQKLLARPSSDPGPCSRSIIGGTSAAACSSNVNPWGGGPSEEWREAMAKLQREYAEALQRIDSRFNARMSALKAELSKSREHELPPSYPPSDVDSTGASSGACRPPSDPETVETDLADSI